MKFLVKILLLGILISPSLMATKPGYYNDYAHEMSKKLYNILVQSGYCLDINECKKKEYFLYTGTNDGLDIELYGITDPDVLKEIANILFMAFKEKNKQMNISLVGYQQSHKDVINFGLFTKKAPFIQLILEGEK
jgi:hypothetical protein